MGRYQSTGYPEVRFWCLQTLADAVARRPHLPAPDAADAPALRAAVASWVHEACVRCDPPVPPFIKNKLAQVTAFLVGSEARSTGAPCTRSSSSACPVHCAPRPLELLVTMPRTVNTC